MSIYTAGDPAPRISELIGKCASAATGVETQLSLCMGSMLGVENAASVAVYLTLRNAAARREALKAAAANSLTDEEQEIFRAHMVIYERLDSNRNDIVHGMWGTIYGEPDASLWCSTKHYATWHITDYHKSAVGNLTGEWRQEQFQKCFYWPHSDIERIIGELISLARCLTQFHSYLRYKGQIQGDAALAQLGREPMVQTALAEMRAAAEMKQQAQSEKRA